MCGFIFYLGEKRLSTKKKNELKKITKLISHRGPDFSSNFINNNIFAHHCRLSIQDLKKRSNQPFFSDDKRYMLLFNGEIYNFQILKKNLTKKYIFKTTSDTEVVLASFLIYGKKFVSKLNGMFSILIFDFKLNEFIVARDPFGQKPLYFYQDHKCLIISSEIKPIQKLKKLKINKDQIFNYFITNNFADDRKTIIKQIFQLRGGEIGHFRKKKLNITKFFSKQDIKYKVNKKNNFKNSLKKTIKNHMISDTKIGIAISSGLDSRSICALLYILKLNRQIFKAYFIEFSDFKIETTEVIRFCNHFKINLEIIKIKSIDIVKNFEKCLKYNEAPLGGIMNIALFALCKKAKKDNVKVILGGYGLDEALGGYDILNPNLNLNSAHSNQLIDGSILDNSKLIKKKYKIKKNKSKNFINDNFIHKKQINLLFKSKIPRTLHMIDRFSMCNSIEFRNPYIDSEFVKSCMQIPKKNFFNKKIGKMPVRNILNNNFKDYQFWIEAKKSVQSPQDQWLKKKLIRQWIDGLLKKNFLYESYNFLSKKEINQYWKNFINNEKSLSLPIWQVINLYFLKRLFK